MPEKKIVPAISTVEEFEQCIPCFLDTEKTLALLLDFDGTLAPIVDNPDEAKMSINLEKIVNKLSKHPKIFMAVISGRGLQDIKSKVGIEGITYSGNHGIEIEMNGSRHDFKLPDEIQESFKNLVKKLKEELAKNGAWVEDKQFSLTYHYRDVSPSIVEKQKKLVKEIIEAHGFKANSAHEAIEAKPPVNWNKGEAALYILEKSFGKNWSQNVKAIFVGDDTTDEDAMRALQGIGKSFRISNDPKIETYADYRLPCQDVVTNLMTWICRTYS